MTQNMEKHKMEIWKICKIIKIIKKTLTTKDILKNNYDWDKE